jgi:hypothetical protein
MCNQAVPKLVGDGLLSMDETGAPVEFINRSEEINRGLDRAGDAHAADNREWLDDEHQRNVTKASNLLEKKLERRGDLRLINAAQAACSDFMAQSRRPTQPKHRTPESRRPIDRSRMLCPHSL